MMRLAAIAATAIFLQQDRSKFPEQGPAPAVGATAPDFTLPSPDGKKTVQLSKLRGKPVVLVFGSYT